MHGHVSRNWTLNLNRLGAVTFLGVELASVHRFDVHNVTLGMNAAAGAVWSRDNCATSRIETKISLVHQLFVEARVNRGVIIGYYSLRVDLNTVFEKFV
jgi:hypothetical protein